MSLKMYFYVLQINKDPDVRLDPFFVVGEEIPKKVLSPSFSMLYSSLFLVLSVSV